MLMQLLEMEGMRTWCDGAECVKWRVRSAGLGRGESEKRFMLNWVGWCVYQIALVRQIMGLLVGKDLGFLL